MLEEADQVLDGAKHFKVAGILVFRKAEEGDGVACNFGKGQELFEFFVSHGLAASFGHILSSNRVG